MTTLCTNPTSDAVRNCEAILSRHRHEMLGAKAFDAVSPDGLRGKGHKGRRIPQYERDAIIYRHVTFRETRSQLAECFETSSQTIARILGGGNSKEI